MLRTPPGENFAHLATSASRKEIADLCGTKIFTPHIPIFCERACVNVKVSLSLRVGCTLGSKRLVPIMWTLTRHGVRSVSEHETNVEADRLGALFEASSRVEDALQRRIDSARNGPIKAHSVRIDDIFEQFYDEEILSFVYFNAATMPLPKTRENVHQLMSEWIWNRCIQTPS